MEDADTFEGNALIKARAASEFTGLPSIADDSGISVDALGGAPGVHSARYAGTRNDSDNVALLLQNMVGVSDRTAQFTCAAALVLPGGFEHVELGTWPGTVLLEPVGADGFGYDPIFKPNGLSVSSAELRPDEKNAISHRHLAFTAIMPIVRREVLGE